MNPSNAAVLLVASLLCGCDGAPALDVAPGKTVTYYSTHLKEAGEVADRCKQLDAHKQATLSARRYQAWQISSEAVNCQTALSVTEAAAVRELVLKQSKPSARLSSSPVAKHAHPVTADRSEQELAP